MSLIKQECIEKILNAADIVDIIGRQVDLKKKGVNYSACCPFHDEKTASFSVSPIKQVFKCFGCGEGGNVIKYLELKEGKNFKESIEYLAGILNISLEYEDRKVTAEEVDQREKAKRILELANREFQQELGKNKAVLNYLHKRGYDEKVCQEWDIGYSPIGWQFMTDKFREKGWFAEAEKIGVIKRNQKDNGAYDVLRARVTIPIYSNTGLLMGFGGRDVLKIVDSESNLEQAKYINPVDSFYYNKSYVLFGLNHAAKSIRKLGFAILTEGYFDVIGMHAAGFTNTVAGCGTAFTREQAKLLKRYTDEVWMMYDGDKAGRAAMVKNMDILLPEGFTVKSFFLPEGMDPDDWSRKADLQEGIHDGNLEDFLLWWAENEYLKAREVQTKDRVEGAIASKIACIPKENIRDHYIDKIASKLKLKKKVLKDKVFQWAGKIKEEKEREERRKQSQQGVPDEYKLPYELTGSVSWIDIKDDVENYALFIAKNKVWSRRGEDNYFFEEVSNFSINIIQHMEDEKIPMKLVQIENVFGKKRTFDTRSEDFTTIQSFVKVMSGKGNFNWKGSPLDFQRLITKLYDEMGDGRMVHVLGWQEEGFFAFSNAIAYPDGRITHLDQFGCFDHNKNSFYIPAGNQIYNNNPNLFLAQKKVFMYQPEITMSEYFAQVKKVHREHAMNAILFSISSMFSDIVHDRVSFFPLLFLYGEASSGKDNLIECCQAFFGKSQSAITITGKANTDKAKIRKFAQMRNMIVHMSEYKNGDEITDQMIMGLWDRRGYERANLDSGVGTESVPILSSVIFTSNEYPAYDPLITRFIAEEMMVTDFTEQQKSEYEKLKEMIHKGVSGFTCQLIKLRNDFDKNFRKYFKDVGKDLRADMANLNLADRMLANSAVLGATLKICEENKIELPFTWNEWLAYMKKNLQKQNNKRETGSVVSKWWDCLLEAVKDGKTLVYGRDLKIGTNELTGRSSLYVNFKSAYNAYLKMYYLIFRGSGYSKSVMQDKLKKSKEIFIQEVDSMRMGGSVKTSAYEFDLKNTGIEDELLAFVQNSNAYSLRLDSQKNNPMGDVPDDFPFEHTPQSTADF